MPAADRTPNPTRAAHTKDIARRVCHTVPEKADFGQFGAAEKAEFVRIGAAEKAEFVRIGAAEKAEFGQFQSAFSAAPKPPPPLLWFLARHGSGK